MSDLVDTFPVVTRLKLERMSSAVIGSACAGVAASPATSARADVRPRAKIRSLPYFPAPRPMEKACFSAPAICECCSAASRTNPRAFQFLIQPQCSPAAPPRWADISGNEDPTTTNSNHYLYPTVEGNQRSVFQTAVAAKAIAEQPALGADEVLRLKRPISRPPSRPWRRAAARPRSHRLQAAVAGNHGTPGVTSLPAALMRSSSITRVLPATVSRGISG